MRIHKQFGIWILFLSLAAPSISAMGESRTVKMATTTSTENSGLLDRLLPEFTKETGIRVMVFSKGTGAALRDGIDGNVDILFVHAKQREESFVANGGGAYRLAVMHNDFVILGPTHDPAGIKGIKDVSVALKKVAEAKAVFISRGDDSGTHIKEQALWKATKLPLREEATKIVKEGKIVKRRSSKYPEGLGNGYLSIGQGMGKTLTYADEKRAYTLSDRGTYLRYKFGRKEGLDLEIFIEGDPMLHNPYGIIPVNPERHPHVNYEGADRLAKWLVSPKAQGIIGSYRIQGHQAFFPDAVPAAR